MREIENWLEVANGFFQEACEFMKMDSNGYVFKVEDVKNPFYTAFPQANKYIVISNDFLVGIIEKQSPTVLRFQMYVCARLIYQQLHPEILGKITRTQNANKQDDITLDSMSFSFALSLIKGIQTPDMKVLSEEIAEYYQKTLLITP